MNDDLNELNHLNIDREIDNIISQIKSESQINNINNNNNNNLWE